MTKDQLDTYKRKIECLKGLLDDAYLSTERVYQARIEGLRACDKEMLEELALQAADINEGGDLRMWLVGVFNERDS